MSDKKDELEKAPAREKPTFVEPPPGHTGTGFFATSMDKAIGMARKNSPVSYTHLRAHETVLDLVCRLLLEKKNSNIPIVEIVANNETIFQHTIVTNLI